MNRHGVVTSMSRKGDCRDKDPMESFFRTLKTELVHHRDYTTRREAKSNIFNHTELSYNSKRRHSAIGYISPAEFVIKVNAA